MRRLSSLSSTIRVLACAASLLTLVACASARPVVHTARVVMPTQWPDVVDCVMLAARASELFADADSTGITVTPGFTPLAQARGASRSAAVGTIRVASVPMPDGLHVTAQALNWDPPAAGRTSAEPLSATRAVIRQVNSQCLAAYPSVATR